MAFVRKLFLFSIPILVAYYFFGGGTSFDPESVRGKRVLVTGASSGIGEQVAYRYSELGAKLVITARRTALLAKVAKKCKELGAVDVLLVTGDMVNSSDRLKLVAESEKFLGGLDILILNHGFMDFNEWTGAPENVTFLQNMLNVNFISYVDLTSSFQKSLEKSKGRIGVVSALGGKVGSPGFSPFCASKHALQGFYTSFRQELRHRKTGVSVSLAMFGYINTEAAAAVIKRVPVAGLSMDDMAGNPQDAATALVRGVANGAYHIYYPPNFFINTVIFLHEFFPQTLEEFSTLFIKDNADK